jgi:hypothetical protein
MRFAPERPWMRFSAEQWLIGNSIDFRWQANFRMGRFLRAQVVDAFEGGKGMLSARVLGFIPIARSRGPETDRGESMRGLAELPWRPFAFHEGPCFTWEAMGAERLRVTYYDGTTQAAIEFEIDDEGHVLGGAAPGRPRMVGKSLVETPWLGTFSEYRMFDGIRVPTNVEATWHLADGPFTYWRGRVTEFRVLR